MVVQYSAIYGGVQSLGGDNELEPFNLWKDCVQLLARIRKKNASDLGS